MVIGNSFANAIKITGNTCTTDCGGNSNGAIEFNGISSNSDSGNCIGFNTIEITHYKYGIWLRSYCANTIIEGNGLFDVGVPNTSGHRMESTAVYTWIVDPVNAMTTKVSDASNTMTYITPQESIASVLSQPWTFTHTAREQGGDSQTAWDIFNTVDNSEVWQTLTSGTNPVWGISMKPSGGAAVAAPWTCEAVPDWAIQTPVVPAVKVL